MTQVISSIVGTYRAISKTPVKHKINGHGRNGRDMEVVRRMYVQDRSDRGGGRENERERKKPDGDRSLDLDFLFSHAQKKVT